MIEEAIFNKLGRDRKARSVEVVAISAENIKFKHVVLFQDWFHSFNIDPPSIVSQDLVEKRPVRRELNRIFHNILGPLLLIIRILFINLIFLFYGVRTEYTLSFFIWGQFNQPRIGGRVTKFAC